MRVPVRSRASAGKVVRDPAAGFTLIETAIVLAVLGIVMGGGMVGYAHHLHSMQVTETRGRLDTVMGVLSAYVQRHNRLPCPATPTSNGVETFPAAGGTSCFDNASAASLYQSTQGVLPWRTLGVPESMARDSWGRLITYKPAPQLTLDTYAPAMQDTDGTPDAMGIHNACRTLSWFSNDGANPVHINRAQALFCCNAGPKADYMPGGAPANWRNQSLRAAGQGAGQSVIATAAWMDAGDNANVNGVFDAPRHVTYGGQTTALADSPLIRASTNAVTLVSHGGNGLMAYILGSAARQQQGMSALIAAPEQATATDYANTAAAVYNPKLSGGAHDATGLRAGASDDIVMYMRSDQLYARAGQATCRPTVFTPGCNGLDSSNTMKDVTYLIDTSQSMNDSFTGCTGDACRTSRLTHTKNAFKKILPKHVNMEVEYDDDPDPDKVAINYFRGDGAAKGNPPIRDPLFPAGGIDRDGAVYDADGNLPVDRRGNYTGDNETVQDLYGEIDALRATEWTPLAQSLLDTAIAMGEGEDDEPNTIVIISDGMNNKDVCIPDGPEAGCYGRNDRVVSDDWTPIQKATNYIRYKYENMRVMVIDVSGNTDAAYVQQMQRIAGETGGQYRQALNPDTLDTVFDDMLSFTNEEQCM